MLDDLLRYKINRKYLVFDFECESLNLHYAKPFQLSFIIGQNGKILEEHDYYIDVPDLKMSKEAAFITRFDWDVYNSKKKNKEYVLEKFEKYLYDPQYIVVGHNILNFDIYIHNTLRRICGKKPDFSYLDRLIDTNCLAKAIKCNISKPKNDTMIQWMFRLSEFHKRGVKTSMKALLKEYDIEFEEEKLHSSIYDILMNYSLFCKLIWNIEV